MRKAAMDIGTNSTRLLVVEDDDTTMPRVLHRDIRVTRIGEGMGKSGGRINDQAIHRTVVALKDYAAELKAYQIQKADLVATAAVREAVNKEVLTERVLAETGLTVKVIPGEEEARLSYLGVVSGLGNLPDGAMVIDVGGGSTEFIWQKETGELRLVSVPVGAVRATEGQWTDRELLERLLPTLKEVVVDKPQVLIGVGGTATTLVAMELEMSEYDSEKVHGSTLSYSRIHEWHDRLANMSVQERKSVPGLMPQRADIIVAGTNIILNILRGLELDELRISETDLLWGLIFDNK